MNAVEIEEAISALAEQPFDVDEFPFAFLEAFGNKATTIKRLRSGTSNKSDLGGVLQTNNIHIAICPAGEVTKRLAALKASPETARAKAKFVLATDGDAFEAEDLNSGETVACAYSEFPGHFGFFLPLAGITTVKQIRESTFDIKATGRLNKLYIELLKDNPEWGTEARCHEMNQLMARMIFCFFAEDTGIFNNQALFTSTIEKMSTRDSSNTHEVIGELFRAMNVAFDQRAAAKLPRWSDRFPFVNGGLFSKSSDVPRFSRIARSYLIHIGRLDWTKINPDIIGSMIQAVTENEERGALGMHYTSVPNILKVLNPLFLNDLRGKLEESSDNSRKLLNLRNRMTKIRIFDPACGSGNFLVIAYKEMRAIEAEINKRRRETGRKSDIPLTNFRGIEIRGFSAEIARLALVIAEYQCDVLYRGQKEALTEFLPLDAMNWITCGNALRLDWLSICPPTGTEVKHHADDLFHTPFDQPEIDFRNEGGKTYICGNPPYRGSKWQADAQKSDLESVFANRTKSWKSLDYVSGWFMKAAEYGTRTNAVSAFVATNSICQGSHVSILWPLIFETGHAIAFSHTSFKWANLASHNAGVTVAIIGITNNCPPVRRIFSVGEDGQISVRMVDNINGYLVAAPNIQVTGSSSPIDDRATMQFGNHPYYGVDLIMTRSEADHLLMDYPQAGKFIRQLLGSKEVISGIPRACVWVHDADRTDAEKIPIFAAIFERVRQARAKKTSDKSAQALSQTPYRFRDQHEPTRFTIAVPRVSSEKRLYLPVGLLLHHSIVSDRAFALHDAPLWNIALIASRLHWVWVATVCGRLRTDISYSNTLGWNTFPVPALTEKNKVDLTRCSENILLAREAHFPATIADLYDPDKMPDDLRAAHDCNDETLERIYIGRRFRNDTERLEKLFEMYLKMTSADTGKKKHKKA